MFVRLKEHLSSRTLEDWVQKEKSVQGLLIAHLKGLGALIKDL